MEACGISEDQSCVSNKQILASSLIVDENTIEVEKPVRVPTGLELAECETQQTAHTYSSIKIDDAETAKKKKKKKKSKKARGGDCSVLQAGSANGEQPISILECEVPVAPTEGAYLAKDASISVILDETNTEEQDRLDDFFERTKIRNPRKVVQFGKKALQRMEKFLRRVLAS